MEYVQNEIRNSASYCKNNFRNYNFSIHFDNGWITYNELHL